MSVVSPTVTAYSPDEYHEQVQSVADFSERPHIDLSDGIFASPKTVGLKHVWWPEHASADLHLMYLQLHRYLPDIIALMPDLVIVHAEAEEDMMSVVRHLKDHDIRVGLALLQQTDPEPLGELLQVCDHALVFSGSLGSFGGTADMRLLKKVASLKHMAPHLEIGWGGGVTAETALPLSRGGVDVLYVGGAIQRAAAPGNTYRDIVRRLS